MPPDTNILKFLRENWIFLVFFVSLITTWVRFGLLIENHETRLDAIETKLEQIVENNQTVGKQLTEINVTLKFYLESLNRLEGALNRIENAP